MDFEKGTEKIIDLIEKVRNGEITIVSSFFLIGEVISTFDKWLRLKWISDEEFAILTSRFVNDIRELFEKGSLLLVTINPIFIMFSVNYIVHYHLAINDAIHLYSASLQKREIDEFICSDEHLKEAAAREGFFVSDPEEF